MWVGNTIRLVSFIANVEKTGSFVGYAPIKQKECLQTAKYHPTTETTMQRKEDQKQHMNIVLLKNLQWRVG